MTTTPDPDATTDTGRAPFVPDLTAWEAWRPEEVAKLLDGVRAPWYVAAGWAIDLFLGYQHREHEDLEVAVPQDRFGGVAAALAEFEFFVVGDGLVWPLEHAGEAFTTQHQTWVRERATGRWRLDVFREPAEGDTWVCRRDARIRLPYERLIARTPEGIPYAQPEIALLFKAKGTRPKDDGDFAEVLPRLGTESRRWLREALVMIHPGHHWLDELR